jgi:enamine deaminase RidA (YjgF/YER057c/UK114 family)
MPFEKQTQPYLTRHGHALVETTSSCFVGSDGAMEYNFMLKPLQYGRFSDQLDWLEAAIAEELDKHDLERGEIVFSRFFCSDLPNQIHELRQHSFSSPGGIGNGAISLVNQPPEAPAKATLWVYCVKDPSGSFSGHREDNSYIVQRGELTHVWTTGVACHDKPGSYSQTHAIFETYNDLMHRKGMTLEDNCLRTWFYVKDIDTNYNGLVTARNEVFKKHNLTPDTHYIASTGIEGSFTDVHALAMMDAYAIKGIRPEQVEHLHALDHLSHTHCYGVAFERATAISYRDRKHVIVSGTASIDSRGEIVHKGDVLCQLDRTLENICALLAQADASMEDMQHFTVYLRDPSDAEIIRDILKERIGDRPFLVVTGPVCRPNWLVEIEGIAVVPNDDDSLPAF